MIVVKIDYLNKIKFLFIYFYYFLPSNQVKFLSLPKINFRENPSHSPLWLWIHSTFNLFIYLFMKHKLNVLKSVCILHNLTQISFQYFSLDFCHPKMPRCINGVCLDNLCYCNDGFGGKGCEMPGKLVLQNQFILFCTIRAHLFEMSCKLNFSGC